LGEESPSLVDAFYDRFGDINVWRDRVHEFEIEHRVERTSREQQRNQGLVVKPPERQFIEQYFTERTEMIQEILEAQKDADQLCVEYRAKGYKLKIHSHSLHDADALDLMHRASGGNRDTNNATFLDTLYPLTSTSQQATNPNDRIIEWLRDVSVSGPAGRRRASEEALSTVQDANPSTGLMLRLLPHRRARSSIRASTNVVPLSDNSWAGLTNATLVHINPGKRLHDQL